MSKLPKIIIPQTVKRQGRYDIGGYLCVIDKEQKEKHYFTKDDGSTGMLYIDRRYTNNHTERHQNIAKVVDTVGEVDFEIGTELICYHYSFSDHTDELHPIWIDENDEMYFRVLNEDVYFGIVNGEIVPRKGNLLCEPVVDKLYETKLHLAESLVDERRDLVKILKVWEGCTEYKEGDYIVIVDYADYPFTWNGKKYLKVDAARNEVMIVSPTPNIRKGKVLRKMTEEQRQSEINIG